MNKQLSQQEKKYKTIIGKIRVYDDMLLCMFLEKIGITKDQFVQKFNYQTRETFLASAPAGMVIKEVPFSNITPTVGFAQITKALSGNLTSLDEIEVNVHAFGSGDTEPSDSDTTLETETERKLLSSVSYNGASAFYTAFYDLDEANGTHSEMGLFMNADDEVADDGTLWDRSLIDITKLDTQSLTIDYEDQFINSEE